MPLNWTASGRLLVAGLDETERAALFRKDAKASPTGRAVTDPATLLAQSRDALAAGVSIQAGESDYAVACIASPICDRDGQCVATISIVLPEQKAFSDESHYTAHVRSSAERIEKLMGWRGH